MTVTVAMHANETGTTSKISIDVAAGLKISAMDFVASTNGPTGKPTFTQSLTFPAAGIVAGVNGVPNDRTWNLRVTLVSDPGVYGYKTFTASYENSSHFTTDRASWTSAIQVVNAVGQGQAPGNPTGVGLRAVGAKALRVTADIPLAASSYTIALQNSASVTQTQHTIGGNGPVSIDLINGTAIGGATPTVAASTIYRVVIACTNDFGVSGIVASVPASVTTPAAPSTPAAVTNPAAIVISNTQLQVTFVPAPILTSGVTTYPNTYTILRSTSSGGTFTSVGSTTSNTFTDINLAPNTTYYYKVQSSNESGTGSSTAEFSGKTLKNPGAPENLTSFTAAVSDYTDITLTLVYPGGQQATDFKILRGTAAAGPFTEIATLPGYFGTVPVTRTYLDANLTAGTTYYYQAYVRNFVGTSDISSLSQATDAAPAVPGIPSGLVATTVDDARIRLDWTLNTPDTELSIYVYRATSSGGSFTQIGTASADATSYVDTLLDAGATYYYKIKAHGFSGDSAYSNEASATTARRSTTLLPQSPLYVKAGRYGRPRQVGGRLIFPSDSNRWIVHCQGNWYYAGLKRQLTPPVLSVKAATSSALAAGTYRVWVILYDAVRNVRSVPTDASNSLTITAGQAILVAPQMDGDTVMIRDVAYGPDGEEIFAATHWEYYIANENADTARMVEQLPITASVWEDASNNDKRLLPVSLTTPSLFVDTRRPMETLGENSLPPVCAHIAVKQNRILVFGDKNINLDADDIVAGANITVSRGNHYIEFESFTPTDALIYKQLYINGEPTHWEVWDVDETATPTRAYIRHADSEINSSGYQSTGGEFADFSFAANQSRVYLSNYSASEALGFPYFNPEGFPPATTYEAEFAPEDNTDPNGVIEVGNALIVGKPGKFFYVEGGDEIYDGIANFPVLIVTVISRGSGLNGPRSFARNRNDIAYFVGDSGLHRVRRSVVEKVTDATNCNHMFRKVFDITSVDQAVGEWFSREDYYVCAGLNRLGNSGNRDGFIYDEKNNAMFWFSCDRQLTCLREVKNTSGEFQLMAGDHFGNVGVFMSRGITHDGVDFSQPIPTANSTPISFYAQTGLVDTGHAITWLSFQPRLQIMPAGSDFNLSISIDEKNRMDDPNTFVPDLRIFIDPDTTDDHYRVGGNRSHQSIVRFEGTTPANDPRAVLEIVEIPAKVLPRGASA